MLALKFVACSDYRYYVTKLKKINFFFFFFLKFNT